MSFGGIENRGGDSYKLQAGRGRPQEEIASRSNLYSGRLDDDDEFPALGSSSKKNKSVPSATNGRHQPPPRLQEGKAEYIAPSQQAREQEGITPLGNERRSYGPSSQGGGRGRGGHQAVEGSAGQWSNSKPRREMKPLEALGRAMSSILRHRAGHLNIQMGNDGYVLVHDLLQLDYKTPAGKPLNCYTVEDVKNAVAEDNKQRFKLEEKDGQLLVRATQGHTITSVEAEHLLHPITSANEVPVCVHGTYEKFMNAIWKEGLSRMTRNHIHFATGLPKEDGVISGMRATAQVLIYLDVEKALKDEMKLYISDNKVILTEGFNGVISPEYFARVVKMKNGTAIPLYRPLLQTPKDVGQTQSTEQQWEKKVGDAAQIIGQE